MAQSQYRITKEDNVVVLTGAGISAESGIRTFRDHNGLWENYSIEDVATPEGFQQDPVLVWKFYKQRILQAQTVQPNAGHYAITALEEAIGSRFALITQNVDGLHTVAGTKHVIEMHGSLWKVFCTECGHHFTVDQIDFEPAIPLCTQCQGILRPDIVWFGEIPYDMDQIDRQIQKADYFIVVGTSGVVYPAAGFLAQAKMNGACTIGINLELPDNYYYFDEFFKGKSGDLLPSLVSHWLHI